MLDREEIFEICLEDYTQPRYKSAIRTYYGTEEEICALMDRLRNSTTGAAVRYNETIEAVAYRDLDDEITHTVAGQTLPILKPVIEFCRYETQLCDMHWDYTTYEGAVIRCHADEINLCQSLIGAYGGFERCVKASLAGLRIYHPGVGWVDPSNHCKGFPGMVVFDGKYATTALFASQEHYEPEEFDAAMADVVDITKFRLSVVVADILGEG